MKIEFIDFFPLFVDNEKLILSGTLKVRLPDLRLQILGIFVSRRKSSWFFRLPGRRAIHHETGEAIYYPFVAFEDKAQQRELMDAIRAQAPIFIEQRLADKKNPLILPQKPTKDSDSDYHAPCVNVTLAKKEKLVAKGAKEKLWIDPPKCTFYRKTRHGRNN